MSAKVPETIGRYVVDRLLGQGAMGSVYLGSDPSLGRKVAIKTVRLDLELDDRRKASFLERFRNEARAAARLSHPAIVAVYDVGEAESVGPYLVFEYVSGATLKQILRKNGAMSPADAVATAVQIAGALDTAHAAEIIHRDVKPDNILVGDDGRTKLADFGIARVPDAALTKEGQFLGTPCYAAPETLAAGKYSPRSDIFSFAAVVYELVCGVRAFPGDDAISVAHAVVHEDPQPPSVAGGRDLPKAVDTVVLRGLSKDPKERYGSALELVEALEQAFADAGELDAGAPSSGTFGKVAAGAGIGLAVIGAVAAAIVAFGGTPSAEIEDAGVPDAGAELVTVAEDAGVDAGPEDAGTDAAPGLDAAPARPDTGLASMSRVEREDAAKDAIDRARALVSTGDLAAARRQLDLARELDPESSDLEEVEAEIARRSP